MIAICIVVFLIVALLLFMLYNTSDFGSSVSPEEEEEVAKFHEEAFNERCRQRFIEGSEKNSKYVVKGGIVVEVDSEVSRKQRKSVKKYCATKYMDI